MLQGMVLRSLEHPPAPPRPISDLIGNEAPPLGVDGAALPRVTPTAPERQRMQLRGSRLGVVGYQGWREILLLHWRVPIGVVRPRVDARLDIDTFDGAAWISATPFTLVRGRLRALPPVPGMSTFHELNLRTYVHLQGREPGIWFFSLDASSLAATLLARAAMALPYYFSDIARNATGDEHRYGCWRRRSPYVFDARWTVKEGEQITLAESLADFVLNRFRLYSLHYGKQLVTQSIWHAPWRFRPVADLEVAQNLTAAARLPDPALPACAHYSRGVEVEFYLPRRVQPHASHPGAGLASSDRLPG